LWDDSPSQYTYQKLLTSHDPEKSQMKKWENLQNVTTLAFFNVRENIGKVVDGFPKTACEFHE
jgi:hypothetical protein